MEIKLTPHEYDMNRNDIEECLRGELCKIMRIEDKTTGQVQHFISADVTEGGWTSRSGRAFHPHDMIDNDRWTGLGTFFLIRATELPDGGCLLEFTDDLNPELP